MKITSGHQDCDYRLADSFFPYNVSDEPDANDILLSREQAQIFLICVKRRWRKKGPEGGLPSENS
jgi:hypothetical protein